MSHAQFLPSLRVHLRLSWLLAGLALPLPAISAQDHEPARTPAELPAVPDIGMPWVTPVQKSPADVRTPASSSRPASARRPNERRCIDRPEVDRSRDVLRFDEPGDGALWVRGRDYKASFGAHGFEFTPFLGSDAPRNYPVACTLASVELDGLPVALGAGARFERRGATVQRDLGALVERYDVSTGSIEQSLVLKRPCTGGDARVRLELSTELACKPCPGGLRFSNDRGGVECRDAFALDSAGRRLALELTCVDGALEMRVPADFLAAATWPVTIDPVWSTFPIDTSVADTFAPDVSSDISQDTWIACYEEVFSAADHDVVEQHMDLAGNLIAAAYVDQTSQNWVRPRVANNGLEDRYLIVATVGDPLGGARVIMGRGTLANLPALGAAFQISGAEVGDKLDADVGGDPESAAPSYFCVVWSRVRNAGDHDVHARLVNSDAATLAGAGTIFLENSVGTLDRHPAISNSDGRAPFATQEWNVVWQRQFAPGDEDVYGAQIHWNGVITTPSFPIDTSASDDTHPTVTTLLDEPAGTRDWLVAWERDFGTDHDIVARALNANAQVAFANLSVTEGVYYAFDQLQPAADCDGEGFVIAYMQDTAPDYDPLVATLHLVGSSLMLGEGSEWLTFSNLEDARPAIVSSRSSGGERARCFIAYERDNGADSDIRGALYDAVPYAEFCDPRLPGVVDCPCGNAGSPGHGCASSVVPEGGKLRVSGLSSPESIVLHGSFMPANAACIYLQGDILTDVVFGDGVLCAGGTLIRLRTKVNVAGGSQFPEPGDPLVSTRGMVTPGSGARRVYQAYYRNAAVFCTSATFNATNAAQIAW